MNSVGEERAGVFSIVYSLFCCFCSKEFPLTLGTKERLRYFIMVLPGDSI